VPRVRRFAAAPRTRATTARAIGGLVVARRVEFTLNCAVRSSLAPQTYPIIPRATGRSSGLDQSRVGRRR
jgi:hypothetical protein